MTNVKYDVVEFEVGYYDQDGVEIHTDIRHKDNVKPNQVFWQDFYCDSPDKPVTVKLLSYEIEWDSDDGEYDYYTEGKAEPLDPKEFELKEE